MDSPATTANRMLVIHPDAVQGADLTEIAAGCGFDVYRAHGRSEALAALEDRPEFAVILIGWTEAEALERRGAVAAEGNRKEETSANSASLRSIQADRPCDSGEAIVDLVTAVRRASSWSQVLVVADNGVALDRCRELVRNGVNGFVRLPGNSADREAFRTRLAKARQAFLRSRAASRSLHETGVFEVTGFIGCSRAMRDVLHRTMRAARVSDAPVLIFGESGTGKQLLSEAIHRLDPKRCGRRMISVNCAAIAGTLADSALFGHVKGAFTGATESRLGHFRAADGGTILLDEIGELDLSLQPKLLRVLQEGLVMPVGADEEKPVDVRVLAATNRRLEALVEKGRLRLDLFQRLNVITIEIPPLRERPEDIPALVRFFLKRYAAYYATPITAVDDDVYEYLSVHRFDGNARELENLLRRLLAFKTQGDRITMADLRAVIRPESVPAAPAAPVVAREVVDAACNAIEAGQASFVEMIDECERLLLARAIRRSQRTQTDLAKDLGLSRRTLYNKRRKHRL